MNFHGNPFFVNAQSVVNVNFNVSRKFLTMARIVELLRSPRKRSRVTELCQEKTDEKGMFQGVVVAESRSVLARYGPITAQRRSDVTPQRHHAASPRTTASKPQSQCRYTALTRMQLTTIRSCLTYTYTQFLLQLFPLGAVRVLLT